MYSCIGLTIALILGGSIDKFFHLVIRDLARPPSLQLRALRLVYQDIPVPSFTRFHIDDGLVDFVHRVFLDPGFDFLLSSELEHFREDSRGSNHGCTQVDVVWG